MNIASTYFTTPTSVNNHGVNLFEGESCCKICYSIYQNDAVMSTCSTCKMRTCLSCKDLLFNLSGKKKDDPDICVWCEESNPFRISRDRNSKEVKISTAPPDKLLQHFNDIRKLIDILNRDIETTKTFDPFIIELISLALENFN